MAFIGTFKENYKANLTEKTSIEFTKGEKVKILDETSIFYILDLGSSEPIGIRKHLVDKSGTGVEWYSDSFYQLYKDKTSWKKKFRMHIAHETKKLTLEINMRYLNEKWEYTEVNEYTNGTKSHKIGELKDDSIKSILHSLLEEDEKFNEMMKENNKQLQLIPKLSASDFEIGKISWKQQEWRKDEVRVEMHIKEEPNYKFVLWYIPKREEIECIYLASENFRLNFEPFGNDIFEKKLQSSLKKEVKEMIKALS